MALPTLISTPAFVYGCPQSG